MRQAILTVLGKDRPGIIAKVTGVLFQSGCNLEDISMTVLEGQLAMIMIVDPCGTPLRQVKHRVERTVAPWKLACYWQETPKKLVRGEKHRKGTTSYLISIYGKDREGIVHKISKLLAQYRLNITDLNSKILGQGKKTLYLMILEVDVPKAYPMAQLQRSLKQLAAKLKVDISIKNVEKIEL